MATALWAIGLVILGTAIGAYGPILLKKGSGSLHPKSLHKNYNLMGGVGLYGLATVIFIPALRGGDLSVLYPFVALSYIWVSLLSSKVLREKMTTKKWFGVVLVIIGVSLIGVGS